MSAPGFWEQLYADGGDGWELGGPAPPLLAWLDSGARLPAPAGEPARVAVPGCGRGHDARLLAQQGYRAWGFDFAVAAVSAARASAAGLDVTYAQRDVFALGPEYRGYFDAVWEYTCYCAIDPARRGEYARVLGEIVRPGGTLLACFFPLREGAGGPPFAVSAPEVERVLAPWFEIAESARPSRSAPGREGLELLVRARRRD